MKMPDTKIAVTLFNLREHCKTESELDRTLDRLCAMGYQCVQVSGCALPADVIRKQLDSHRLFCCATHENLATISGDTSVLVDRLRTLECDFTALGSPAAEFVYSSMDDVKQLAEIFNRKGEELAKHGIRLGFHNHHREFTHIDGTGKTMLETFYELTCPKCVCAELDVHWVTRGGCYAPTWIRKMAGRVPVIHFKDFAIVAGEPCFCEIGVGNLDWPEILKACEEIGVRWYSIEQDRLFPGRDIFESMKLSIDNLHAMGVK